MVVILLADGVAASVSDVSFLLDGKSFGRSSSSSRLTFFSIFAFIPIYTLGCAHIEYHACTVYK